MLLPVWHPGCADDAAVVRPRAIYGNVLLQQVRGNQPVLRNGSDKERAHFVGRERASPDADIADGALEETLQIAGADAQGAAPCCGTIQ